MTRRLLRACWCAALLAPLGLSARGAAKPPDLPLESQNDVRPQLIDPDAAGAEDAAAAFGIVPPTTRLRPTDFTPVPLLPPIQVQKAPTGKLRFGIGVNSDIGLTGSIIVAQACDSPCEPAVKRRELLPAPSLYRLRPSVRRHVAESLLFSVHPLMTLIPTDKLLDCPRDHPQKVAVDVLLDRMCARRYECSFDYGSSNISDVRSGLDPEALDLRKSWQECQGDPQRMEQLQWRIVTKALSMNVPLHVWSLCVAPQQHQLAYAPPDEQEGSQPGASKPSCGACIRMCPRPAEQHVYQFTAPDLTQDLMHNLEKLETAHRLMHLAEHLALSGQVCEALDCFDIVCRMCPGRFEAHVAEIMAQVFSPVYSGSTEDAEDGACEELPAPKEEPEAKSTDKEREIEQRLNTPVSINFTNVPLRKAIEDIRDWHGINIYIDEPALNEEGISLDRPITLKLEQVALKSALNLILKNTHLTYVVKDEVLQITTATQARREVPAGYAVPHDETACPSACPKCERLHAAHAKGVHEQVEGLMQACRLAAEAGHHAKAAELARQAYALDAERVMADPLVYKMHLLALKRDKGKARRCPPDGGAEECEPACPRTEDCPTPKHEALPPPVDGGIVGALEQVLEEAEVPHHTGLSLHGRHFDVDCSWTGLRLQGQVPLRGSLYTLQYRNGAFSGWVTPDPASR
jgi:hypothetical protein